MFRLISILLAIALMPVLASAQISPETILGPPVGIPPNCIGWGNKCAPTTTQWDMLFTHKVDVDNTTFNLKNDFGAKCDGATDDTQAIQGWLNKAAAGVRLIAPAGTCDFSVPLTIPYADGWSLAGAGHGATVFNYTGLDYNGVVTAGASWSAAASTITLSSATFQPMSRRR